MKILLLLFPIFVYSSDTLKLEDYLKLIKKNNLSLKISKNKIKISNINKSQSYYNFLPRINFSYGIGLRKDDPRISFFTGENPRWSKNLSLDWVLFNSAKNFDYIKVAKSNKKIEKYNAKLKLLELKSKVINLFIQLYTLQKKLVFLNNSLELAKENIKRAKLLNSLEKMAKLELLSFELSLVDRKNAIKHIENAIKNIFFELSSLVNKDLKVSKVEFSFDIAKNIKNTKLTELIAIYKNRFFTNSYLIKKTKEYNKISEYNLDLSLKNFIPSITLRYSYSPYTENFYSFPLDRGHSLFLNLNFNIFNSMLDYTNRKKKKLEFINAKLEFKEIILRQELFIKKSLNTLKESVNTLDLAKLALDLSKKKLEQIKLSYKLGRVTHFQVLEAENELLNKENELLNIKANIFNSYYQLELISNKLEE